MKNCKNYHPIIKIISVFVSFSFLLTNIEIPPAFSETAGKDTVVPVISAGKVEIPSELGNIQIAEDGKTDAPLIFYIQDAHAVVSAQRKIQNLIYYLSSQYGAQLVALEGGEGKLDATLFQAFPEPNVKKIIFDEYLSHAEVTGPDLAAVFNPEEVNQPEFYGIENWSLYENNFLAHANAFKKREVLLGVLKDVRMRLDANRPSIYSLELNQFHEHLELFRNEQANLAEFLKWAHLQNYTRGTLKKYTHLEALTNAIVNAEKSNMNELKLSAKKIAEDFKEKNSERLSKSEITKWNKAYQAFLTERIDTGAFLSILIEAAESIQVELSLDHSLREVVLENQTVSAIKGTELFIQLERFVKEVEQELAASPEQKTLLRQYEYLELLKRIANLELINEDWGLYLSLRAKRSNLVNVDCFGHLRSLAMTDSSEICQLLKPAEQFYEAVSARDQAMQSNFLNQIKKNHTKVAIVVAGGFHTAGFRNTFLKQGFGSVVISPQMDSLDGAAAYQKVMSGELSYKKFLTNNFYDAFSKDAVSKLLNKVPLPSRAGVAKVWRNKIIKLLSKQNRLVEAGEYTKFIDQLSPSFSSPLAGEGRVGDAQEKANQMWQDFRYELKEFSDGLHLLVDKKELNIPNVSKLLNGIGQTKPSAMLQLGPGAALIRQAPKVDSQIFSTAQKTSLPRFETRQEEKLNVPSLMSDETSNIKLPTLNKSRAEARSGKDNNVDQIIEQLNVIKNATDLQTIEEAQQKLDSLLETLQTHIIQSILTLQLQLNEIANTAALEGSNSVADEAAELEEDLRRTLEETGNLSDLVLTRIDKIVQATSKKNVQKESRNANALTGAIGERLETVIPRINQFISRNRRFIRSEVRTTSLRQVREKENREKINGNVSFFDSIGRLKTRLEALTRWFQSHKNQTFQAPFSSKPVSSSGVNTQPNISTRSTKLQAPTLIGIWNLVKKSLAMALGTRMVNTFKNVWPKAFRLLVPNNDFMALSPISIPAYVSTVLRESQYNYVFNTTYLVRSEVRGDANSRVGSLLRSKREFLHAALREANYVYKKAIVLNYIPDRFALEFYTKPRSDVNAIILTNARLKYLIDAELLKQLWDLLTSFGVSIPFKTFTEMIKNALHWGNKDDNNHLIIIRWKNLSDGFELDVIDEGITPINFNNPFVPERNAFKEGGPIFWGQRVGHKLYYRNLDKEHLRDDSIYDFPLFDRHGKHIGQIVRTRFQKSFSEPYIQEIKFDRSEVRTNEQLEFKNISPVINLFPISARSEVRDEDESESIFYDEEEDGRQGNEVSMVRKFIVGDAEDPANSAILKRAKRIARPGEEPEDVAQEAFLRMLEKETKLNSQLDPAQDPEHYLKKVAGNKMRDYQRSTAKTFTKEKQPSPAPNDESEDVLDSTESTEPNPSESAILAEEKIQQTEQRAVVRKALGRLPKLYQTVLILKDIEGKTNIEIGSMLRRNGQPVGATDIEFKRQGLAIVKKAREALREQVDFLNRGLQEVLRGNQKMKEFEQNLNVLSERAAQVLRYRVIDGLSYRAITEKMTISEASAKRTISDSKKVLIQKFGYTSEALTELERFFRLNGGSARAEARSAKNDFRKEFHVTLTEIDPKGWINVTIGGRLFRIQIIKGKSSKILEISGSDESEPIETSSAYGQLIEGIFSYIFPVLSPELELPLKMTISYGADPDSIYDGEGIRVTGKLGYGSKKLDFTGGPFINVFMEFKDTQVMHPETFTWKSERETIDPVREFNTQLKKEMVEKILKPFFFLPAVWKGSAREIALEAYQIEDFKDSIHALEKVIQINRAEAREFTNRNTQILVVENDHDLIDLYTEYFKNLGWAVKNIRYVNNIASANAILNGETSPNVVFVGGDLKRNRSGEFERGIDIFNYVLAGEAPRVFILSNLSFGEEQLYESVIAEARAKETVYIPDSKIIGQNNMERALESALNDLNIQQKDALAEITKDNAEADVQDVTVRGMSPNMLGVAEGEVVVWSSANKDVEESLVRPHDTAAERRAKVQNEAAALKKIWRGLKDALEGENYSNSAIEHVQRWVIFTQNRIKKQNSKGKIVKKSEVILKRVLDRIGTQLKRGPNPRLEQISEIIKNRLIPALQQREEIVYSENPQKIKKHLIQRQRELLMIKLFDVMLNLPYGFNTEDPELIKDDRDLAHARMRMLTDRMVLDSLLSDVEKGKTAKAAIQEVIGKLEERIAAVDKMLESEPQDRTSAEPGKPWSARQMLEHAKEAVEENLPYLRGVMEELDTYDYIYKLNDSKDVKDQKKEEERNKHRIILQKAKQKSKWPQDIPTDVIEEFSKFVEKEIGKGRPIEYAAAKFSAEYHLKNDRGFPPSSLTEEKIVEFLMTYYDFAQTWNPNGKEKDVNRNIVVFADAIRHEGDYNKLLRSSRGQGKIVAIISPRKKGIKEYRSPHWFIFAKKQGILTVTLLNLAKKGLKFSDIQAGFSAVVDGKRGEVIFNPSETSRQEALQRGVVYGYLGRYYLNRARKPVKFNGRDIIYWYDETALQAFVDDEDGISDVTKYGGKGTALFRLEELMAERQRRGIEGDEKRLAGAIATILSHNFFRDGKPFIIRLFDVAIDKRPTILASLKKEEIEEVLRTHTGVRFYLDGERYPEFREFGKRQLKAIFAARLHHMGQDSSGIKILFSDVRSVSEMEQIEKLVQEAKTEFLNEFVEKWNEILSVPIGQVSGIIDSIPIGYMFEDTTVVRESAEAIFQKAAELSKTTSSKRFFGIGTNDLFKSILQKRDAETDEFEKEQKAIDELDPRLVKDVWDIASLGKKYGIPVTLEGEWGNSIAMLATLLTFHLLEPDLDITPVAATLRTPELLEFARNITKEILETPLNQLDPDRQDIKESFAELVLNAVSGKEVDRLGEAALFIERHIENTITRSAEFNDFIEAEQEKKEKQEAAKAKSKSKRAELRSDQKFENQNLILKLTEINAGETVDKVKKDGIEPLIAGLAQRAELRITQMVGARPLFADEAIPGGFSHEEDQALREHPFNLTKMEFDGIVLDAGLLPDKSEARFVPTKVFLEKQINGGSKILLVYTGEDQTAESVAKYFLNQIPGLKAAKLTGRPESQLTDSKLLTNFGIHRALFIVSDLVKSTHVNVTKKGGLGAMVKRSLVESFHLDGETLIRAVGLVLERGLLDQQPDQPEFPFREITTGIMSTLVALLHKLIRGELAEEKVSQSA